MTTTIAYRTKTTHITRLVILLLAVGSTDLSAQHAISLSVGAQHRAIEMGYFGGDWEGRTGITARLGLMSDAGGIRMVLGHGPQGDIVPGWSIAMIEIERRFTVAGPVRVGGRLAAGGLGIDNTNLEACNAVRVGAPGQADCGAYTTRDGPTAARPLLWRVCNSHDGSISDSPMGLHNSVGERTRAGTRG